MGAGFPRADQCECCLSGIGRRLARGSDLLRHPSGWGEDVPLARSPLELVAPQRGEQASFLISAEYEGWKRILRGELDPVRAIWTGTVTVRGDLSFLLRYMRAARELLACAVRVPTRFRDELEDLPRSTDRGGCPGREDA
jgi:hypothetical protein